MKGGKEFREGTVELQSCPERRFLTINLHELMHESKRASVVRIMEQDVLQTEAGSDQSAQDLSKEQLSW